MFIRRVWSNIFAQNQKALVGWGLKITTFNLRAAYVQEFWYVKKKLEMCLLLRKSSPSRNWSSCEMGICDSHHLLKIVQDGRWQKMSQYYWDGCGYCELKLHQMSVDFVWPPHLLAASESCHWNHRLHHSKQVQTQGKKWKFACRRKLNYSI